jgi:hypothetical protein
VLRVLLYLSKQGKRRRIQVSRKNANLEEALSKVLTWRRVADYETDRVDGRARLTSPDLAVSQTVGKLAVPLFLQAEESSPLDKNTCPSTENNYQ